MYELGLLNSQGFNELSYQKKDFRVCLCLIGSEKFQRCFLSFTMLAKTSPETKFDFLFSSTAAVQWFLDLEILCGEKSSFFMLMSCRFR